MKWAFVWICGEDDMSCYRHHHHQAGQEWPEGPGQSEGPQVGRREQYDESIMKEEEAEKFKKRESKHF